MERDVDNIRYIYSDSAWYEDDQIWVSSMEFNGLYQYNINSNKMRFVGSFPNETQDAQRLHSKVLKVKNEIYFLPDNSKSVHVYDTETDVISTYEVGIKGRIGSRCCVYYGGRIYFICGGSEIAVCNLDIVTKRIKIRKIEEDTCKYGISLDCILVKDKIYFTCGHTNAIMEYSCEDDSWQKYQIGQETGGFGTICYDGKAFWLSGKNGVVRWEKEVSEVKRYHDYPDGFGMCIRTKPNFNQIEFIAGFSDKYSKMEMPFEFSAFFCGKVWLFPRRTNMIVHVDVKTGNMEEFHLEGEQEDEKSLLAKRRFTHCHYLGGVQDNILIFFSTKSKKIRLISQDCQDIKEFYLRCEEPRDLYMYIKKDKLNIRYEDRELNSLREFLMFNAKRSTEKTKDKKNVGALIYETVKEY